MIRRLFLILAFLLGAAVVAVAVFIATFDANRYRPLLVTRLQTAIGKPVQLQRMTLRWRNGVAIELHGLAIFEDADTQGEPLITVDSVSALVRLLPLLRKQVNVTSVALMRPRVHVARNAQGQLNLLGLAAAAAPATAPQRTVVSGTSVSLNVASLRIHDGTLHWTDAMATPATDLWVKALQVTVNHIAFGKPMNVEAGGAIGANTPNVRLSARVTPPGPSSQGAVDQLTIAIERLSLEQVLPVGDARQPQLRGTLTAHLQGDIPTLDPAHALRAISSSGSVELAQARVANLNILRTVFEKLSVIPGLVERLEEKLPDAYREKLAARDTVFSPIQLSLRMENGALRFQQFVVSTDTVRLTGEGTIGLDGAVNIQSMLSIEPQLSAAIVRSVHELQALGNASGELELPVLIQGTAPQVAVMPDLKYVTSKVAVTTAVDLLDRFLKNQQADASPHGQGEPQPDQQPEDLLGNLLQRAIQKHAPDRSQPQ